MEASVAELTFNILDIAAVMVLIGVFFALWRRARDRDARSVQQFSNDLLPLILLFAISITGLFLTASTHLMHGLHYVFLSQLHAITVIFTLLYLPFGKFFHIFQRPAQLGVDFYKKAGAEGEQAICVRCGQLYGSRMQMEDLKAVQAALGIRYQMADGTSLSGCLSCMPPQESCADAGRSLEIPRHGCAWDGKGVISSGEASDRYS